MNTIKENRIAEILTAISHPNRIRILNAINQENMLCGCEILPMLGLKQSNLSRHLSKLVKAGVLVSWKDGVRMNYKIADERIFNLINLAERIRLELPHDYMLLHPRLCEENGENLMSDLLKDGVAYVTPACKEEKQKKLLRDGFQRANIEMNHNWKPVSISFKNTDTAFNDIQKALEEL